MLDISDFPWNNIAITENRVLYQGNSLSLRRNRRNKGIHRWEFELSSIDTDMADGRKYKAQLSAAVDDTIIFTHPRLGFAQGIEPPLGVAVMGAFAKGVKKIMVAGFGESWSLMAGDLLQFANDTKVYEVAKDTTYATGTREVELTFALRNILPNASVITMNNVTWHLISNGSIETAMEAVENQDIELTLIAVEKL